MNYYYAQVVNGVVVNTVVVDEHALWDENGFEREEVGAAFCQAFGEGQWIRTYLDGEKRKWYGRKGCTYRADLDAFVPPKPPVECTLNEESCHWFTPEGVDLNFPPAPQSTDDSAGQS
ncbi:hypothetical protein UFOVP1296_41 [uncultured Caudovirales phage]|uniref:Uncharacterized protein n=1 Tax=uncultured Caudovirales phage TaxID=2100421 RepID=A0A6J5PHV5_9CAUD|nr:hypothetical protein UFOVP471_53 [uncultured Caudovirales phage]CAB4169486.1 hypothetical protein UFOVP890_41 [uncultured Caudovirales phage]CAB4195872.1 hypothetical protein UFOVP1296_41 [uncultured Caudovirales phage]